MNTIPMNPPTGVSLRKVLPHAVLCGAADVMVRSCTDDTRRLKRGDVFVAMRGAQCDGHQYILDAVKMGASAVVAEQRTAGLAVPQCVVPHAGEAYGRLCQALAGGPSRRLKTIGVTGTNGKTTTTYLIAGILERAGYQPGILGTLGYCDRLELRPSTHTTPPADVLADWLGRMDDNACTHAVMEVSSHALCQRRIAGVRFDMVCYTNVRHDHLDYHGTLENYRAAKGKLLDYLAPEGVAVFNADDEGSLSYMSRYGGPALTVGMQNRGEVTAEVVDRRLNEQTFYLCAGDESVPVRTPLIGLHNVYNALTAAAVGLCYGMDMTTIAAGIEDVKVMPGRLERLECGQPFSVFVDYAHTPDALAYCLDTLRPLTRGRLFCLFGAGGERDQQKRPLMGRTVAQRADLAVVSNDNPRREPPARIVEHILMGMAGRNRPQVILDRASAIEWTLRQAQPGDCVLIAGKGHEDYQEINGQRLPFDDREIARNVLWNLPAANLSRAA